MINAKTNYNLILLVFLLTMSTLISAHYVSKKTGYYVDEGMTLFLANSRYNGAITSESEYGFGDFLNEYVFKESIEDTVKNIVSMIADVTGKGDYSKSGTVGWYDSARKMIQGSPSWISGQQLQDRYVVVKENRFDYGQVYINQIMDVHPIIYYLLVHTVFSLFAGKYSIYFLWGINIFFLLASAIILYYCVSKYLYNDMTALAVVTLFVFSQAYFSNTCYFRMYAVLTFMCIATYCLHCKVRKNNYDFAKQDRWMLGLVVFGGANTHYYYLVYLGLLFLTELIILGKHRKESANKYLKTIFGAGIVSLVIWPFSLYHIFFGYRGTEAVSKLTGNGLLYEIKVLTQVFTKGLFGGNIIIFFGIVLSAFVCSFWVCLKKEIDKDKIETVLELCVPVLGYILLIGKVSPEISMRYFYCLTPMVCIMSVISIKKVVSLININERVKDYVVLGVILCFSIFTVIKSTPDYLFEEQAENILECNEQKSNLNALVIGGTRAKAYSDIIKLSEYNQVMVLDKNELEVLETTRPEYDHNLVVYVDNYVEQETTIDVIRDYLDIKNIEGQIISGDVSNCQAYFFDVR